MAKYTSSNIFNNRDKEMVHSVQSTAVDVFPITPPFLTNSTVVPLSASSGSFAHGGSPYVFPLSDPPIPLHTHPPLKTRLLELADTAALQRHYSRIRQKRRGKGRNVAISLSLVVLCAGKKYRPILSLISINHICKGKTSDATT